MATKISAHPAIARLQCNSLANLVQTEIERMILDGELASGAKNRGVFVRDVPMEEALEIFEVRAVMDLYVGRKLAQAIHPTQVRELRQLVDAMLWDDLAKAADLATPPLSHYLARAQRCMPAAA